MTFAIPAGLFCVVFAVLYLMFSRPHRRVPAPVPGGAVQAATPATPAHAAGGAAATGVDSTGTESAGAQSTEGE